MSNMMKVYVARQRLARALADLYIEAQGNSLEDSDLACDLAAVIGERARGGRNQSAVCLSSMFNTHAKTRGPDLLAVPQIVGEQDE